MGEAKRRGTYEERITQNRQRDVHPLVRDWTNMFRRSNKPNRYLPNFSVIVYSLCAIVIATIGICLMLIDTNAVHALLPDNTAPMTFTQEMIERIRQVAVPPFVAAAIFAGHSVRRWFTHGIPNIPLDGQVLGIALYTTGNVVGVWALLATLQAPLPVVMLYLLFGTPLIVSLTYNFGALGKRFGLYRT